MDEAMKRDWWKLALGAVVLIELAGGLSGWLSQSGYGNPWFDGLQKPSFMPPGWAFGVVWSILYALLGISVAMILAEPESDRRRVALAFFWVQLAKFVIWIMALLAAIAARQFLKIRRAAGLLMVPYLAWLVFAATLNATIEQLNPGAGTSLFG
jgi:tryptophan-rich sensory protein